MNSITLIGIAAFVFGLSIGFLGFYHMKEDSGTKAMAWLLVLIGAIAVAGLFLGIIGTVAVTQSTKAPRIEEQEWKPETKLLSEIDAQLLEIRVQLDDIQTSLTEVLPPVLRPTVIERTNLETGDAVNVPRRDGRRTAYPARPENGAFSIPPSAR